MGMAEHKTPDVGQMGLTPGYQSHTLNSQVAEDTVSHRASSGFNSRAH